MGDAIIHRRKSLVLPVRMACVDPALARRSLGKLTELPVNLVLFGHGRPLQQGAGAALRGMVQGG